MTRRFVLALWLAGVAACALVVGRVQIGADLSAFLPRNPTPEQRLLADQLRDGVVSRLVLIAIEGGDPQTLAAASQALAARLRAGADFVAVDNGDEAALGPDLAFLREHRYRLSPRIDAGRYTVAGLRAGLQDTLAMLASPLGMLVREQVPRDPTGELAALLDGFAGQGQPARRAGVWMSADAQRAVLLAQTAAAGYDIDAQQRALARIETEFAQLSGQLSGRPSGRLSVDASGPAVFAVRARAAIEGMATRMSIVTTLLVGALMLAVYRSPRVLLLSLLPVASGGLAGIAAVSLAHGVVYGVTLGFGITLIGESIDYAIYFFARLAPDRPAARALGDIWPTLRLGVLTSIAGFAALLFGGFPGLAQLGLFSIAGLVIAILVTRHVLPALVPEGFTAAGVPALAPRVMALIDRAPRLRAWAWLAIGAAAASIALHRGPVWSGTLASLSPVPAAEQARDAQLRRDLGAPDVRHLVIVSGADEQRALERAEAAGTALDALATDGAIAGYESPARFLPSGRRQRERLAALPDDARLRANLAAALHGLPFRAGAFAPFLADAAAARAQAALTRADLAGTHFAMQVDSLLARRDGRTLAILPLRGVVDAARVEAALAAEHGTDAVLLDLRDESDRLYRGYLREAIRLAGAGAIAIVLLLWASLRSPRRVLRVLLPVGAAVLITLALVLAAGRELLLFHLVGVLLAVAIGSNYALFFDRERGRGANEAQDAASDDARTMVSLLLANVSTVIAFGMLATSGVPVLASIGVTVALGAWLSLVFSAVLAGGRAPTERRSAPA